MSTCVNFYKGTQPNLPKSNYQPGAFYLTTDTSRLYFANSASELLDLNKYILFVDNIDSLPSSSTVEDGDIYYCKAENVLATYIKGQGWQQINRNTDTDSKITKIEQEVTSDENGVSVKLSIFTRVWDEQTQNWVVNSAESAKDVTFVISKEDIYDVIPEPQVDVRAKMDGTDIAVYTEGDGSAGDGFKLKPGNGMTFSGNQDELTIDGSTYTISSPANTAQVKMENQDGTAAGVVTFKAGTQMTVSGTTAGEISYGHATISTDKTTAKDEKDGFGQKIEFVKALGFAVNGHVNDYDLGSFEMPAEPNYRVTSIGAGSGENAGKLSVGIQDSQGSQNGNTLTSGQILYYTLNNGTTYYNTQKLPVYTVDEIEAKLRGVNAMTYKGTVNNSNLSLPTANVKVGDTYKNIADGATYTVSGNNKFITDDGSEVNSIEVELGDLFIATGTEDETTGYITGAIKWSYIPSGDDLDSKYEFTVNNNVVTLVNKSTPTDAPGAVTFAAGKDLGVATTAGNPNKTGTITFSHNTHNGTKTDATNDPDFGSEITAVSGLTLSNGHIDGYTLTRYALPAAPVDTIEVLNESNKPTIKLSDTRGNSSNIKIDHDGEVIATPDATTDTITFSHKAHAATLTTTAGSEPGFGGTITAVVGLTPDQAGHGHLDGYSKTTFTLPADPSVRTVSTAVSEASNKVTVTHSLSQPNSSLATALSMSHSFSTNTASIDFTVDANTKNVAIDLVWGSF